MISRLKKNFCGKNSRAHPQSLGTNRFCIYQKCITSLCEFVYIYIYYTHLYVCINVFLHVLMYCSIAYGQPMKQRNS